MVAFGTEEWLQEWVKASAARPEHEGADGTIRVTVERAPQGKVVWLEDVRSGRVSEARLVGPKEAADIELTAPYAVALELWRDGLDPNVAFMQGRLKMSGDAGLWIQVLPLLRDEGSRAAVAGLAEQTEF